MIKYGVVETRRLIADLTEWETLYLSGRLHKQVGGCLVFPWFSQFPKFCSLEQQVAILQTHDGIRDAMEHNYSHALNVALLTLPETFSEVYCAWMFSSVITFRHLFFHRSTCMRRLRPSRTQVEFSHAERIVWHFVDYYVVG